MINRIPKANDALHEAERQVAGAVAAARQWRPNLRRVEDTIVDHPKTCLLAALAAGALVGWIIKRR